MTISHVCLAFIHFSLISRFVNICHLEYFPPTLQVLSLGRSNLFGPLNSAMPKLEGHL